MRVATLIIALFVGLAGTIIMAFGVFDDVLLVLDGLGVHPGGLARFALLLIPELAIFGAALVLSRPLLATLAILAATLGWGALAMAAGQSAIFAIGLAIFSLAALVFAIIAIFLPQDADEEEIAEAPPARMTEVEWAGPEPARRAPPPPPPTPPAPAAPERILPSQRPPRPTFVEPDEEGLERETVSERIPAPSATQPFVTPPFAMPPPANAPFAGQPAARRPAGPFMEVPAELHPGPGTVYGSPEDEDLPPPEPPPEIPVRPIVSPQPAMAPPPEPEPEPDAPAFGGDRDYFGEPRRPVPEFEPYDPDAERPRGGWRRVVSAINFILLIALIIGGALALYLDYERGPRSAIFGTDGLLKQFDLGGTATPPADASGSATSGTSSTPAPQGQADAATPQADTAPPPTAPANTSGPSATEPAAPTPDTTAGSDASGNPDVSPLAPPIPSATGAAFGDNAPAQGAAPAATETAPAPVAAPASAPDAGAGTPAPAPEPAAAATSTPAASPAPASEPQPATPPQPNDPNAPIPAPPLPDRIPSPPPAAAAQPAQRGAPVAAAADASTPAAGAPATITTATTSAPEPTYTDAFAYCEAVGTVDAPDPRYAGPAVPQPVAAKLGVTTAADLAKTHWRCMSRNVLACRVQGTAPVCDQLPTVEAMVAYCKANPASKPIQVPTGSWSCKAGQPVIPKDQKWPADRRGFFPPAWVVVPNVAAAAGLSPNG